MSERLEIKVGRKAKDGKTYWTRVGVMFPNRSGNGYTIRVDSGIAIVGTDDADVSVQAFPPREEQQRGPKTGGDGDDIPF